MLTKRQKILAEVKTRFEAIRTVNGYQTELGQSIFRWRVAEYKPEELPAASIYDFQEKQAESANLSGVHKRALTIEVEVKASGTPDQILTLFADVEQAIAAGDKDNWGGNAVKTVPLKNNITVEQGTKKVGGGLVAFEIHYYTESFNAYE